ncbi:phosphotransferase [Marinobacter sp.]|uniref:phosphotransferase n=1 Tax=Marinobacter sp. TaxID=50741 RepID=UPI001B5EDC3F|nr:phosphotransferase [Marinobacter sp.]MBQ0831322.1 phosphotransferase [Marinobacter sp.]
MLFVKELLAVAGLTDIRLTDCSVACISTTRPIYLVFGHDAEHPAYVIRRLTDDHDFQTQQVHKYLYQLVDKRIPKPVGIFEHGGQQYDIQYGVKGAPWFQVKSKFHTEAARAQLEARLWQTLVDFHSAIAAGSNTIETNIIQPHDELIRVFSEYHKIERTENAELVKLVESAVNDLSGVPGCSAIPQHGDFCLNNLIIDTSHITVIDFEDYEITKMPMYDHFTLALSLPSCSEEPNLAVNAYKDAQIAAAAEKLGIAASAIQWHFLHHILLRLGPWSTGEKRAKYRAWLKQLLASFIEANAP